MNAALKGALAQLAKSKPSGVPSKAVILAKPDKNKWSGKAGQWRNLGAD